MNGDNEYLEAALEAPSLDSNLESNKELARADGSLFNARAPRYINQRETWQHRVIAFLKAEGYTNKEIADRTGYSALVIGNIIRQPCIVELIRQELSKAGRSALSNVLSEEEAIKSIEKLIELRNGAESQEVQRKAANDHLNRIYGCPNQSITHTQQTDLDKLTDAELLKIAMRGKNN